MTLLYRLCALMRWLFRRHEVEQALDSDLFDYIERSAAEKVRSGMTEAEARRSARIELGGVEQTKERVRVTLALGAVEAFIADVGYAFRTLSRHRTFTAVAVLTLALGIGASTTIFSVVNAVLLKPLPYANPDRFVRIIQDGLPGSNLPGRFGINAAELDDWRKAETLSHVALVTSSQGILATGERTVRLHGARVSPALFAMRGVQPLLGRGLLPEEERADADVMVLSEAAWREHLGADPGVVGRTVALDGRTLTVVGVMPPEFGPEAYWTPFYGPPPGVTSYATTYGRLRDGVSLEAAAAEVNALGLALHGMPMEPDDATRYEVVRELDEVTARVVPALRVLVVGVTAVLLIVCTNVANLLLARGTQRHQEIAIRRSLGATRGRIIRLVLAESLTLAAIAGALGTVLALGAVQWLKSTAIVDLPRPFQFGAAILPRAEEIAVDPVVLLFVGGLSVITGTVFGVLPALRLSRFGEKGHNAAAQLSATSYNTRVGHVLATVQLAFATTLLIGAGLLLNSFVKLAAVDAGFDARGVLNFEVVVPLDAAAARKLEVAQAVAGRLQEHPRVTAVGFTDIPPLTGSNWRTVTFVPEGMTAAEVREIENGSTQTRTASPGYLRALGARLVDGAWFPDQPNAARLNVLVSRPYAERYFPGRRAVGATLQSGDRPAIVLGVVDDIRHGGLQDEPERVIYMEPAQSLEAQRAPYASSRPGYFDRLFLTAGGGGITFAARVDGDPSDIVDDLRAIVRDIDPGLAVDAAIPMDAVLSGIATRPRFYASLLSSFGAIAGFVAVIGIYGVLAYLVSQRAKEIGIRMALGAQQPDVLKLVLRRGVAMISIGVITGVLGAVGLTRYLEAMLSGITSLDATTYATVGTTFAAVALLASYVPARHATRVDPMKALRYE